MKLATDCGRAAYSARFKHDENTKSINGNGFQLFSDMFVVEKCENIAMLKFMHLVRSNGMHGNDRLDHFGKLHSNVLMMNWSKIKTNTNFEHTPS